MNVKVFQFNGCTKCFYESMLLQNESDLEVEYVDDPENWSGEKIDTAVIAGYLLPENEKDVLKISNNADKIVAYGDCTTTGGVFGLANQKGHKVTPISKFDVNTVNVNSCLGEFEELRNAVLDEAPEEKKALCQVCKRKSTCEYLDEVVRQIDPYEDQESCFNDMGFMCNGYVAKECKERCIDYETQCRGCKPVIDRSGIRMLGMFGTLMGNIDMATEASKYGATDKLADDEDEVTRSVPDVVGNFFRFTLPSSGLPPGKIPSQGTLLEDVFVGRTIEEFPLITGLLGGKNSISLTLNAIETYEKDVGIGISDKTKEYRQKLKNLEKELHEAISENDAKKYKEITDDIRRIAGNMNLSNLFYGGFKTPIDNEEDFQEYKSGMFEIKEGTYKNGSLEFSIDADGIITEIKMKEEY